jgi:hypothetical protein
VAIPYPGIGGVPRVAALGCTLLTSDQADVRTQPRDRDTFVTFYRGVTY